MKRAYVVPRAEKLEFDFSNVIFTSGRGDRGNGKGCGKGGGNNGDRGHGVGKGFGCNAVPGHLAPDNNPKTAHPGIRRMLVNKNIKQCRAGIVFRTVPALFAFTCFPQDAFFTY